MVRKAEFDENIFIEAAIELVASGGPAAATMSAIARYCDAPTGSIYHRYQSRSALLAMTRSHAMTSLMDQILPALSQGNSEQAILSILDWIIDHPSKARLIMLYEENDLIDGEIPNSIFKNTNDINKKLGQALTTLLKIKGKQINPSNMALANYAIFDGPIAAMKPFLRNRLQQSNVDLNKCKAAAIATAQVSLNLLE